MTAPKATQGGPRARVRPAPSGGLEVDPGRGGTGSTSLQTAGGVAVGDAPPVPLEFVVLGNPAPQGSKHGRPIYKGRGEARAFTGRVAMVESSKEKVTSWREAVKAAAERRLEAWSLETYGGTDQAALYRIIDRPVHLEVDFCFDKPASAPKRRRVWPIKRSTHDVDKLQRSTFDALTEAGVFKDDSQVVRVTAGKYFTDDPESPLTIPGARIRVWDLTPRGIS
jgi:crossover junction endodeoxyribonuclease RusA